MSSDSIKISIELADAAAQKALTSFISNSSNADKSVKKLGDTGKSTFNDLTVSIGKTLGVYDIFAGNLAANLVNKALDTIKGSIHNLIAEASASEQAIKNLEVALDAAGLNTGNASEEFQKFAGALQETTIYSDEAVLASSTLLLNMTSLSKDGIQKATQAAADLAATLNIDLNTATEMINKAVNGNTIAFKKQGIEIQSATTESGRLSNILKALESQQGKAAQQADTYAGATAKAANQQSELFEALGKVYTQSQAAVDKTNALSAAYGKAAQFITDNTDAIRDFGTALKITAEILVGGLAVYALTTAALGAMGVASFATSTAFVTLSTAARAAWIAITGPIGLIVIGITAVVATVYTLVRNWDAVRAGAYNALAATLEFAAQATSVLGGGLSEALKRQAQSYRDQATAINEASVAAKEKSKEDLEQEKQEAAQAAARQKRLQEARKEADLHSAFLLSKDRATKDELFLNESEFYIRVAELSAENEEAKLARNGELTQLQLEKFMADGEARLVEQQALDAKELELQIAKQTAQAQSETDDRKRREALKDVEQKASVARESLQYKQSLDRQKLHNQNQKKLDEDALRSRTNTLNLFATLQDSNNDTLATIGKAAALTQIAIAAPVAIAEAFKFGTATGGPILGGIFGGIAAAAMAAQAAKVVGIAFEDGGIVPGGSFTGDRVQARVNSGEMVLNRQQQTELFKMANGSGGGGGITRSDLVSALREVLSTPINVNVDGRELFNITRDQLASGRSY